MSKEVLLISDHPDDPSFLAEVVQQVGAELVTVPDPQRAMDHLESRGFAAIFFDVTKISKL